jgi:predicted transcriptional regulator
MPKSFRIDPALEQRLCEVARREGTTVSAVVREAITRHCDQVLGADPWAEFADLIGVVHSEGGRARRTGEAFKQLLAEREQAKRERAAHDPR